MNRAMTRLLPVFLGLCLVTTALWAAPTQATLERARELEALYHLEGPSIPLSAAYRALPPEQRQLLLGKLKAMVLAQVPPEALSDEALAQLPPEAAAKLRAILALAQATSPEQMDAFILTQDLDHLLPVPPEAVRLYHDKAWAEVGPDGAAREEARQADLAASASWLAEALATPGYLNPGDPAPTSLELLTADEAVPSEEVPQDKVEADPNGLGLKVTRIVKLPDHALANSKRLARALNHLCNATYDSQPLEVRLAGERFAARNPEELLLGLAAREDLQLRLYDARMFVNFVGMSMPHGEEILPVRIPTWFQTAVSASGKAAGADRAPLIMPGNHSEHLLVLHDRESGRPQAMVKWYMGLPSGEVQQGTLFKPAVTARDSWCGFRIVHVYESPESLRLFARSAPRLMRMFNFMQKRHAFPKNGYAILAVCDDTTGLMEGILRQGESTVWPLVRDPRLDFYLEAALSDMGIDLAKSGNEALLAVPSDARPDLYPQIKEAEEALRRLGANVPTRDPGELAFPKLGPALGELAATSATFRQALERQD